MAVLYVYHAGDDSTGASWAAAYQSIENAAILGAAAGTEIWVASDHVEQKNGAHFVIAFTNGTYANPIKVISVKRADDTYENMATGGGTIETQGAADDITISGNVRLQGIKLDSQDYLNVTTSVSVFTAEDCDILAGDALLSSSASEGKAFYIDSRISVSGGHRPGGDSTTIFRNCVWSAANAAGIFDLSTNSAILLVEDCDLSAEPDLFARLDGNRVQATIRRCRLGTGWLADMVDNIDHPDSWVLIESCDDGTQADPILGLQLYRDLFGNITPETTNIRTGGASDGTTSYSWKMVSTANALEFVNPLRSPPVTRRVDGGSAITVTAYVYHDAVGGGTAGDLENDEFWIELSGPDDGDYAQGYNASSRMASLRSTPADLDNDGVSSWAGGLAVKQKIDITYTPQDDGPISVRFCLAKPSVTIYVDPKLGVA